MRINNPQITVNEVDEQLAEIDNKTTAEQFDCPEQTENQNCNVGLMRKDPSFGEVDQNNQVQNFKDLGVNSFVSETEDFKAA